MFEIKELLLLLLLLLLLSSTEKKELNNKDSGSANAEIICLIKYGEYPSGSHVHTKTNFRANVRTIVYSLHCCLLCTMRLYGHGSLPRMCDRYKVTKRK